MQPHAQLHQHKQLLQLHKWTRQLPRWINDHNQGDHNIRVGDYNFSIWICLSQLFRCWKMHGNSHHHCDNRYRLPMSRYLRGNSRVHRLHL